MGFIRVGWIGMQMPDADDALFVGYLFSLDGFIDYKMGQIMGKLYPSKFLGDVRPYNVAWLIKSLGCYRNLRMKKHMTPHSIYVAPNPSLNASWIQEVEWPACAAHQINIIQTHIFQDKPMKNILSRCP